MNDRGRYVLFSLDRKNVFDPYVVYSAGGTVDSITDAEKVMKINQEKIFVLDTLLCQILTLERKN